LRFLIFSIYGILVYAFPDRSNGGDIMDTRFRENFGLWVKGNAGGNYSNEMGVDERGECNFGLALMPSISQSYTDSWEGRYWKYATDVGLEVAGFVSYPHTYKVRSGLRLSYFWNDNVDGGLNFAAGYAYRYHPDGEDEYHGMYASFGPSIMPDDDLPIVVGIDATGTFFPKKDDLLTLGGEFYVGVRF
jgi:hypothetical protein